jgi:putative oxidoreductase
MKKFTEWLINPSTTGSASIFLIRIMVGSIFFWEGILKFVYTNQGTGRFTKLGFPFPESSATLIAIIEIIVGLFIIAGFFSRASSLILAGEMIIAILLTKIALFNGTSPLPLPPVPPTIGIWAVLHEIRTDYALLMSCLFLVINGPGKFSLDAMLHNKSRYSTEIF